MAKTATFTFIAGPLGDVFRVNHLQPRRKDFRNFIEYIRARWHWSRVLRVEAAISTGLALIERRFIDPKFWKSRDYLPASSILEDCVTKARRAINPRGNYAPTGWVREEQAAKFPGIVSLESETPQGYRIEDIKPPTYRV